jgi:hypothetical protein
MNYFAATLPFTNPVVRAAKIKSGRHADVDRDHFRSRSYGGGCGDLVPAAVAGRCAVLVTAGIPV